MSDEKKPDDENLNALMAAAKQKMDSMSAAVQAKYNEASAEAAKMVDASKEAFNQGMQKADQLADAAKAKFNDGMEAAQQLANDTKAKFEAGMKAAGDFAADAKMTMEKGIADAKQQGAEMMSAAKDRIQSNISNLGESDKTVLVEAGKQAANLGANAMGYGANAMGGMPGAQDVAKAWQNFQDAGGMPVAKAVAEQKLEDAGIRSTDTTINKMVDQSNAEKSKFADNDFNRMNKAVEQDAKAPEPQKTVDDSKFVNPKGPQDSKFLSDELKAKYLSRAQDMGQDAKQASAHWDSSNPKPPQNQPAADKPAVTASPSPSTSSPSTSSPSPSPSPSPKP